MWAECFEYAKRPPEGAPLEVGERLTHWRGVNGSRNAGGWKAAQRHMRACHLRESATRASLPDREVADRDREVVDEGDDLMAGRRDLRVLVHESGCAVEACT